MAAASLALKACKGLHSPHLEEGLGCHKESIQTFFLKDWILGSRNPGSFVPLPQSPANDCDIGKVTSFYQQARSEEWRLMARLQRETNHRRGNTVCGSRESGYLERFPTFLWFPLQVTSAFWWQPLPTKSRQSDLSLSGSYPERPKPVREKETANWHYLLAATQTHGTGLFQNFSNWSKVGMFLKINKGVKSRPAGLPGLSLSA